MSDSNGKKEKLRSAANSKLPLVSVIPDTEMVQRAIELLKAGVKHRVRISEEEEKLEKIKDELEAISSVFDLPGFRHGRSGFQYHGAQIRRALNLELLVEKLAPLGVTAAMIGECYKESEPYADRRIVIFDIE